jgi:hypothetical protein
MVDDSQPVVDEKSSTTYCAIPCVRKHNITSFIAEYNSIDYNC